MVLTTTKEYRYVHIVGNIKKASYLDCNVSPKKNLHVNLSLDMILISRQFILSPVW